MKIKMSKDRKRIDMLEFTLVKSNNPHFPKYWNIRYKDEWFFSTDFTNLTNKKAWTVYDECVRLHRIFG